MADHTHIEWTDATWNPITGCSVVSAGCKHCYAMKLAGTRLQHHPSRAGLTTDTKAGPVWNGQVRLNEAWLDQPLWWRRPRRIFVCAHGDLFHESVPDEWIDQVFAVMALAPQHTFQVLTKRPERMRAYLANAEMEIRDSVKYDPAAETLSWPLPNVWLGVSVEDQAAADERIPLLLATPAAVRWVSAEPLLGPVDLRRYFFGHCPEHDFPGGFCVQRHHAGVQHLHWVVAGGESGTGARPMHPDWARSLRDQCAEAGVPFLFKQWGAHLPADDDACDAGISVERLVWSDGSEWHESDGQRGGVALMARVGKKAAGRLLDGQLHDEYPAAQEEA